MRAMKIIIMKQLVILLLVLVTFSCNNKSDKDPTDNSVETTTQVEVPKIENREKAVMPDTTKTNYSQDFTYELAVKNKTSQRVDDFMGFENFYKQFDKPSQTFTLKLNENKTITCKEGTKISIKSNSFVTKSGRQVKGDINIQVKEFYKTSDILLANLTTTSNNEMLETGGMLNIEVFSGGERCELKEGKTIEITFPTEDKKEDMKLFNGSFKSDKINWTLEETKIFGEESMMIEDVFEDEEVVEFALVEIKPEFPGGQPKMFKYLSSNVEYPIIAIENGVQGRVYIGFIINENGETENVRVIRGVDASLNQAAISVIEQMPKWTPGKQRGKFVKVNMVLPIAFTLAGEGFSTNNTEYAKEFENNVNDDNLSETKMSEISQYIFSTSSLGWINCDRFYRDNRPQVDYIVNIGNSKQVDIKIVFNSINSILTGSKRGANYTFDNVPSGHSVTLVALKYENGQYYLAIKKTKITRDGEPMLDFEPVTMERLKTEMEKLNKI